MRKFLTLLAVLVCYALIAPAQTKIVTGKVVDAQNLPIPFASIRIKGGKQGVSADADGNFSIKVRESDVLVVTGAGLTQKEVPVGGAATLTIEVARKEANLTEVVVTALG